MFRASVCPFSGILGCVRVMLLHMVQTYTSAQDYTPAPQNLTHNT